MSQESSPKIFARVDGLSAHYGNALLLIGRVLFGWLLLISGWAKFANIGGIVGYLTALGISNPGFWAWPAATAELVLGGCLVLGLATRYAAVGSFIYIVIATAIAHRYWEFAPPRQTAEYINFLKNLALMGGAIAFLVVGAGRFSIDSTIQRKERGTS
jgi:putative oxidoreductase